jgi:putative ABC transport system permease protein
MGNTERVAPRGTAKSHGSALGEKEVAETKKVLGLNPDEHFAMPKDLLDHARQVKLRGGALRGARRGVLAQRGALFGQSRDNFIAIPLGTARRLYGENQSVQLQVQAPNRDTYAERVEQARGVLRTMRQVPPGDDDDFEIVSNESAVSQFRSLTSAIRLGVAAISSIALIAAGIGIMNIMLVSVTERTREIGIRRAIGARKRSVMLQFIAEAVLLSEVGGALGVVGGILFGNLISFVVKAPPVIPWDWVGIGLAICSAVGILFGTYPAWKAAHLDPIDSLRYE